MSTLEVVTEPTYHALARTDAEGNPLISNAQLVMGDGTSKVTFKNGRAVVPESLAAMVAKHPNVEVVGFEGATAPKPAAPVAPAAADGGVDPRDEQIRQLQAALAAATGSAARSEPAAEAPADVSDEVRAAMEHLASEGEEIPEVEKVAVDRTGFDALTADGQPRCQAAKADGSQCSNPAGDGQACGLSKHQEQLA